MRRFALVGFAVAVALGLASRALPPTGFSLWDQSFGDAAYAVMLGFLLLALRPALSGPAVGAGAFAICFALELLQLTGLPLRAPQPLRFLLGSAFAWSDVACYAVGGLAVALAVQPARRRSAPLGSTPQP